MRYALALLLAASVLIQAGEAENPQREIRIVENYVPYEQFLTVVEKNPSANVMSLEEYRALSALALASPEAKQPAALPPIQAQVSSVSYEARAQDNAVRFDARFEVTVAGTGWVRCPLGAMTGLGALRVDGKPAWVVVENGFAHLLLKGEGRHEGTASFSVPLKRDEDTHQLETSMFYSAASSLKLHVPGRATLSNAGLAQSTQYDAEANATRFDIALGHKNSTDTLSLQWKRSYDAGKNPPLLFADQTISYLLERASPLFYWKAEVLLARRKTDELVFTEPGNVRLVRIEGAGIHSWHRDGAKIRVLLAEPTLGRVQLAGYGVYVAPQPGQGDFEFRGLTLNGARRDTRTLLLVEPPGPGLTLAIPRADGLREKTVPTESSGLAGRTVRAFLLERPDSSATVRATPRESVFETQTAAYLLVDEKRVLLRATYTVEPAQGRLYALTLNVPAPWKLASLREGNTGRALRAEKATLPAAGGGELWQLTLDNAALKGAPVEIDVQYQLEESAWSGDEDWSARQLNLTLPSIPNARRTTVHLGVATHPAIDAIFGDSPAWRTEQPGTLAALGFSEGALRAGLWTESPAAPLALALSRKVPRGEVDMVAHVLAQEREAWVRCDLRLSVVDRAVEELTLTLPAEAKDPLHILGEGISETLPGATPNQRRVRFNAPWLGLRTLRVEYRTPLVAGSALPVPIFTLGGNFEARRGVVFQSAGAIELTITPGPALQPTALDDVPSFAVPFKQGRSLYAFTLSTGAEAGSFQTRVFERTPTLRNLASDMTLVSVLDRDGVSRTHASFVLAYARQQYVQLRLPLGARPLALTVDDVPAQPTKTADSSLISIPLPPRSRARVELVYERSSGALGRFGTWTERAPELIDIPVGATEWKLYHPASLLTHVDGGNLLPALEEAPQYFVSSFWARLFSGKGPRWTAWERHESRELYVLPTESASAPAQSVAPQQAQQLQALETKSNTPAVLRAMGCLAIPEGALLSTSKIGGGARLSVSYTDQLWLRFAPRVMFLLALVVGFVLYTRVSQKAAVMFTVGALVLGTLIPLAFGWQSPLLLIPFCEGASLLAFILLAAKAVSLLRERLARRARVAVAVVVLGALLLSGVARAGEAEPQVLIPYDTTQIKNPDADPKKTRVYVPDKIFKQLMSLAYPEKKKQKPDAPKDTYDIVLPYAFGEALYELNIENDVYTLRGTLQLATFHPEGWAKIPVKLSKSALSSLTLDGQPATLAQDKEQPFIQIFGAGSHTLQLELKGAVQIGTGSSILAAEILPGSATRVKAVLPPETELHPAYRSSRVWISKHPEQSNRQICEFDLGSATTALQLGWQAPGLRARGTAQVSTRSYSHFQLGADGFAIARFEHVTLNGAPLDTLSFQLHGDWDISSVNATELAAWSVNTTGETRTLELFYRKPVASSLIEISGWAPLTSGNGTVPHLALQNALRQEGYIGLEHGSERRFTAESLDGLKRSSLQELARDFQLPASAKPDRIYHWYEPPLTTRLAIEAETHQAALETHLVGVVLPYRLQIFARSRYTATGRLPLRHETELPAGWDVRSVRGSNIRRWDILTEGGVRKLVIELADRDAKNTELFWSADAPLAVPENGTVKLDLPLVRSASLAPGGVRVNESTDWVLAADEGLTLSQDPSTTLASVPIDRAPAWVVLPLRADYRVAFRSTKPEGKLIVEALRQDSLASAIAVSFIRAGEESAHVNVRLRYLIGKAGMEKFSIRLPQNATLVGLDAKNLRSREVTAGSGKLGALVTVLMQSPVAGEQFIDLTYRFARAPGEDTTIEPLVLEDKIVRKVEHFVGIVQAERGVIQTGARSGLMRLKDREELPFLPNNVSMQSLTEAYSAEMEWSLMLRQAEVKVEAGPPAEISLAVLTTVIANDGGVRHAARYRVRNRSLQFIRIALPTDAKLWGIFVDGQPASASSSQGTSGEALLQVPIPRMSLTDLPMEILAIYETNPLSLPAAFASYTPRAPIVLDMTPVKTFWHVFVPKGYEASRSGGNVKDVIGSVAVGTQLSVNVDESERLIKIIENPETPASVRTKALRNLAPSLQELNDNYSMLNSTGQRVNDEESRRVARDEIQSQIVGNSLAQQQAVTVQDRAGKWGKEIAEAVAGGSDPREKQALADNWYFLANRWRGGKNAKQLEGQAVSKKGEIDARELNGASPARGFKSGELPPPLATAPSQFTDAPKDQLGLREETPMLLVGGAASELKLIERGEKLSFHRVEGHPELSLSLRSTQSSWQYGALAALVGLVVVGLVLWRRRRAV